MKTGALDHPKMKLLGRRIGGRARAIGTLQALWTWAASYAPGGDIGRWPDESIADAVFWEGNPEEVVTVLVECGWVDKCDTHRLVIHDWSEHCENSVHARLAQAGKTFADGNHPNMKRLTGIERERARNASITKKQTKNMTTVGPWSDHGQTKNGPRLDHATDTDTDTYALADTDTDTEAGRAAVAAVGSVGSADVHLNGGVGEVVEEVRQMTGNVVALDIPGQKAAKEIRIAAPGGGVVDVEGLVGRIMAVGAGHECPPAEWWRDTISRVGDFAAVIEASVARVEQGGQPFSRIQQCCNDLLTHTRSKRRLDGPAVATEGTGIVGELTATVTKTAARRIAGGDGRSAAQVEHILKITGEPEPYRAWWAQVIERMRKSDGMDILEESTRYAADCLDQHTREAKGLGPLNHPGRYIASKCKEHLERNNVTLPPPPAVRVKRAVNGEKR